MGGSEDARLQQSEFRDFAEKIWTGEEPAVNEAREEGLSADKSFADEFTEAEKERGKEAEDWAQEHAEEESWGDKFAAMDGDENFEEELFNYLGRVWTE